MINSRHRRLDRRSARFGTLFITLLTVCLCLSSSLCHGGALFPRRLLPQIPAAAVPVGLDRGRNGQMEQGKKAVEQSLRKAPPSRSNPIQNK
ncbi:hypothetical protein LINPERHAP2_LOCUS7780 [Linum perenne]